MSSTARSLIFSSIMAASATSSVPLSMMCMPCAKSLQNLQLRNVALPSRLARGHIIRAAQMQSAPPSREVDNLSVKGDSDDAALKVFADDTKGIVCYQSESGEVVCEGMDEGPQFYPPCGANLYMPDTRAAAILPLLGEVMYEI